MLFDRMITPYLIAGAVMAVCAAWVVFNNMQQSLQAVTAQRDQLILSVDELTFKAERNAEAQAAVDAVRMEAVGAMAALRQELQIIGGQADATLAECLDEPAGAYGVLFDGNHQSTGAGVPAAGSAVPGGVDGRDIEEPD